MVQRPTHRVLVGYLARSSHCDGTQFPRLALDWHRHDDCFLYVCLSSDGISARTNRSVLSPAIFHGTINAIGPIIMLMFAPDQPLLVSPAGLTTSMSMLILATLCHRTRRKIRAQQLPST